MSRNRLLILGVILLLGVAGVGWYMTDPGPLTREKIIQAIAWGRYGTLDRAGEAGWLTPKRLGEPPLHIALKKNNVGSLSRLLALKVDPDLKDSDGRTALHLAAEGGNLKAVRFLLRDGADPNRYDKNDESPLVLGARKGHQGVVKVLLGNKAKPELWAGVYLEDLDLFRKALKEGQNPNLLNFEGLRPLTWLLQKENLGMVRELLAAEELVITSDDSAYFRPEWLEELWKPDLSEGSECLLGDLNARNFQQNPLLIKEFCQREKDSDICQLACEGTIGWVNPMNSGYFDQLPAGLRPKFGVNQYLLCSAKSELWRDKKAWEWFSKTDVEGMKKWLKLGGGISTPLCMELAPIHLAVLKNSQKMVQALVEVKANLNQRVGQIRPTDKNLSEFPSFKEIKQGSLGEPPILLAAQAKYHDMAGYLVVKGANPNFQDVRGKFGAGWSLEKREMMGFSVMMEQILDLVFQYGKKKRSLLHEVARVGDRPRAELLLKYEAWPELEDGEGKSPGDLALEAGAFGLGQTLKDAEALAPLTREEPVPISGSESLTPSGQVINW